MKIYLDFDGTVVEHKYPAIGKYNNGAFDVVKKLIDAGHEVILNTYRVEISREALNAAIDYLCEGLGIKYIRHTTIKFHPGVWDFKVFEMNDVIYIDDTGEGHPMKDGMIDWAIVDIEFESHGIY